MNSSGKRTHRSQFSAGWLDKFKAYNSNGESHDADQGAIEESLPEIKLSVSKFALKHVFNADEYGHFYQMAPTKTITTGPFPVRKKQNSRLKYLACSNADGSEKDL